VGEAQRLRHLAHDLDRVARGEAACARQVGELVGRDQLHGVVGLAGDRADVVDRNDAGVGKAGRGARLALEAVHPVGIGAVAEQQDLERDLAFEVGVPGAVDLAHAAVAELGAQLVAAEPARAAGGRRREGGLQVCRVRRRQLAERDEDFGERLAPERVEAVAVGLGEGAIEGGGARVAQPPRLVEVRRGETEARELRRGGLADHLRDLGDECALPGVAAPDAGAGGLAAGQAPLGGERGPQPLRVDRPARQQDFAQPPGSGARALVGESAIDRVGGGQAVAHQDGAKERVLLEDEGVRLLVDELGDPVGCEGGGLDQEGADRAGGQPLRDVAFLARDRGGEDGLGDPTALDGAATDEEVPAFDGHGRFSARGTELGAPAVAHTGSVSTRRIRVSNRRTFVMAETRRVADAGRAPNFARISSSNVWRLARNSPSFTPRFSPFSMSCSDHILRMFFTSRSRVRYPWNRTSSRWGSGR